MKPLRAFIDSFNFKGSNLEQHFRDENYIIEIVKSVGIFEPNRWVEAFKTKLHRNIIEAKILHTSTGLELPIKRFSTSKDYQSIEFAGLKSYNSKSELLNELLERLLPAIQSETVTRVDVCIDFKEKDTNKGYKQAFKR